MKNQTLVTPSTFAKMTGLSRVKVYAMLKPQMIKPTMIGGKPFIDLEKNNPKNFKLKN